MVLFPRKHIQLILYSGDPAAFDFAIIENTIGRYVSIHLGSVQCSSDHDGALHSFAIMQSSINIL